MLVFVFSLLYCFVVFLQKSKQLIQNFFSLRSTTKIWKIIAKFFKFFSTLLVKFTQIKFETNKIISSFYRKLETVKFVKAFQSYIFIKIIDHIGKITVNRLNEIFKIYEFFILLYLSDLIFGSHGEYVSSLIFFQRHTDNLEFNFNNCILINLNMLNLMNYFCI